MTRFMSDSSYMVDDESNQSVDPENNSFQFTSKTKKVCRSPKSLYLPKNIMKNPIIAQAVDRGDISVRMATMIVSAVIKVGGGDVMDYTLSKSSSMRSLHSTRKTISESCAATFHEESLEHCTIHWDSKIVNGQERLAISISGCSNGEKILGIPPIERGTGDVQADAVIKHIKEWNVESRVRAAF